MLRRRKREIFCENEENSVKTDDFVQIIGSDRKISVKKTAVFAVLIYPPGHTAGRPKPENQKLLIRIWNGGHEILFLGVLIEGNLHERFKITK